MYRAASFLPCAGLAVADILVRHNNLLFVIVLFAMSVLHKMFLNCLNHRMREIQMNLRPSVCSVCDKFSDAKLIDKFYCAEERFDVSVIVAESSRLLTVFSILSFSHHTMSSNIDMKMIRPPTSSGSHCMLFIFCEFFPYHSISFFQAAFAVLGSLASP